MLIFRATRAIQSTISESENYNCNLSEKHCASICEKQCRQTTSKYQIFNDKTRSA